MRVLLVIGDLVTGERISSALKRIKYDVDWIRDMSELERVLAAAMYSVVLIDIGSPACSGIELIRESRSAGCQVPVLAMTADDEVSTRVEAFDAGVDDYITLPFHDEELVARIRAVVRRMAGYAQSNLVCGSVSLDLRTRRLSYNGHSETLSVREFCLMQSFLQKPVSLRSREQLQKYLYGSDCDRESNVLDVLIFSLRRKFGASMIRNIHGLGWVIGSAQGSPSPRRVT